MDILKLCLLRQDGNGSQFFDCTRFVHAPCTHVRERNRSEGPLQEMGHADQDIHDVYLIQVDTLHTVDSVNFVQVPDLQVRYL